MVTIADSSRNPGILLAEELRQKIEDILGKQIRVILFGSYARGDATEESDVDVLVVLDDLDKSTLDAVLEVAWQVGFDSGKVISVVPAMQEEMGLLSASPFFQAVQKEGIPA
jgi:predicted nucleotidyltransferase